MEEFKYLKNYQWVDIFKRIHDCRKCLCMECCIFATKNNIGFIIPEQYVKPVDLEVESVGDPDEVWFNFVKERKSQPWMKLKS